MNNSIKSDIVSVLNNNPQYLLHASEISEAVKQIIGDNVNAIFSRVVEKIGNKWTNTPEKFDGDSRDYRYGGKSVCFQSGKKTSDKKFEIWLTLELKKNDGCFCTGFFLVKEGETARSLKSSIPEYQKYVKEVQEGHLLPNYQECLLWECLLAKKVDATVADGVKFDSPNDNYTDFFSKEKRENNINMLADACVKELEELDKLLP